MLDPLRRRSPHSPVDSAMFPPVYHPRSTSCAPTPCPATERAPVPLYPKGKSLDNPHNLAGTPELEPLEYCPLPPAPRYSTHRSLSSVFGDPDLIDAIMWSLTTEGHATPRSASVRAWRHPRSSALKPCLRKPGTFLNKDGRWIKGKPCHIDDCDKRAQSNGLCKGHGGGARCSYLGCSKSSQGGGFCRAHGGGKRCLYKGCDKGTQRNGFCYLHGGVRSCSVDGCEKKDRGNGKCFSHGGGRKCQVPTCFHASRRGASCDVHSSGIPRAGVATQE